MNSHNVSASRLPHAKSAMVIWQQATAVMWHWLWYVLCEEQGTAFLAEQLSLMRNCRFVCLLPRQKLLWRHTKDCAYTTIRQMCAMNELVNVHLLDLT